MTPFKIAKSKDYETLNLFEYLMFWRRPKLINKKIPKVSKCQIFHPQLEFRLHLQGKLIRFQEINQYIQLIKN